MRRGCVLTIVILSSIALVLSVLFYLFVWPQTKVRGSASIAFVIEDALEQYKADQKRYPLSSDNAEVVKELYGRNPRKKHYLEGLDSIVREGMFTDFWKTPLRIEYPPEGSNTKAKVYSAGPNGTFGDEDDITSDMAVIKKD